MRFVNSVLGLLTLCGLIFYAALAALEIDWAIIQAEVLNASISAWNKLWAEGVEFLPLLPALGWVLAVLVGIMLLGVFFSLLGGMAFGAFRRGAAAKAAVKRTGPTTVAEVDWCNLATNLTGKSARSMAEAYFVLKSWNPPSGPVKAKSAKLGRWARIKAAAKLLWTGLPTAKPTSAPRKRAAAKPKGAAIPSAPAAPEPPAEAAVTPPPPAPATLAKRLEADRIESAVRPGKVMSKKSLTPEQAEAMERLRAAVAASTAEKKASSVPDPTADPMGDRSGKGPRRRGFKDRFGDTDFSGK